MQVYTRMIHRISQCPEQDTEGPFEVESLDLSKLWARFKGPFVKSRKRGHEPRADGGGAVFFLSGPYHALIIMPVGSDLHKKHAPPSHAAFWG